MSERNLNWLKIDPYEPLAMCCWKGVISGMTYQEFLSDTGSADSAQLQGEWKDAEDALVKLGPGEYADIPWEYPDMEVSGTPDMYPAGEDTEILNELATKTGEKSTLETVSRLVTKVKAVKARKKIAGGE